MKKILYILSSKSGKTEFDIEKKDLINLYKDQKKNVTILETNFKNHGRKTCYDFIKKYEGIKKSIIVGGGDGSLNEIVNVVYNNDKENTSLGLIPMGTANDFSKNFSYRNFKIESLLSYKTKKIDLFRVNNHIGINVMSLGFDTVVLKNAYKFLYKNPKLGKKAYIYGVIKSLPKLSYKDLKVKIEDNYGEIHEFEDKFLLLALCNGGYYGSGFRPSIKAKINDGILNLVYAKKLPSLLLPSLIVRYKYGKLENSKYLNEIEVKKGSIEASEKILANIDGEIFKANKIDFELIKNGLNWIYFD